LDSVAAVRSVPVHQHFRLALVQICNAAHDSSGVLIKLCRAETASSGDLLPEIAITPGTVFMDIMEAAANEWVAKWAAEYPGRDGIVSGCRVPVRAAFS
jgi:hypothetical protein